MASGQRAWALPSSDIRVCEGRPNRTYIEIFDLDIDAQVIILLFCSLCMCAFHDFTFVWR
jgi:hypothetical protein